MRIERVKNFFTPQECALLNQWVFEAVEKNWLSLGIDPENRENKGRFTSRHSSDRYKYPDLALALSNRVRAYCGVAEYPLLLSEGGQDGVVVTHTSRGGNTHKHTDGRSKEGVGVLRCNVMTQAAEAGGVLHIGDKAIDIEVGELHCYLASEHEHYATTVEGATPRVLWMFGAHVPVNAWNDGRIKMGAN